LQQPNSLFYSPVSMVTRLRFENEQGEYMFEATIQPGEEGLIPLVGDFYIDRNRKVEIAMRAIEMTNGEAVVHLRCKPY
jgi:hypothetical protein